MTIAPHTRLDHYEILSLLGKGGMGEVYLAHDTQLDRPVALKLLPAEVTQDADRVRRFEQEAKAVSALNHPHIITIHEIGACEAGRFIVMELVQGQTLRALDKPCALDWLSNLGQQIAKALSATHAAGITHRDIKPDNIMLREDGYVKVLDFGLARLSPLRNADFGLRNESAETLVQQTSPGTIMGTVAYMSPEQARGEAVSHASDIFALGIVLYELATGRHPFQAETLVGYLHAITGQMPPPPQQWQPTLPGALNDLLLQMLEKEASQRPTASEVAQRLQEIERRGTATTPDNRANKRHEFNLPVAAVDTLKRELMTPVATSVPTNGGPLPVRRMLLLSVLLGILLLASVGGWFFFRATNNTPIDSLAILPFTNASGDPEMEYLSDGLTESLINRLAQLPDLRVIARTSVFRYKGKEPDLAEVGKALGARAVLTGRVLQRGENLTISAELVDLRDNKQLWGDRYERKATDLLAVQSQLSSEIGETLRSRLLSGTQAQLARRETVNPQAYELLLKGRFYASKGAEGNLQKAAEYYQQATTLDPAYALAWAELSLVYRRQVEGSSLDPKEGTPKAMAAAQKALALNEYLAEAHAAMATLKKDAWDWIGAEQEFKRALELNPNLARARGTYAYFLVSQKRFEQALAEVKLARELDPLSLSSNAEVGDIFLLTRQYEKSLDALKKTLELDPNYSPTHLYLGWTYTAKKLYPEAITAHQESMRLGGGLLSNKRSLAVIYAQLGEREKAQALFTEVQNMKIVPPSDMAAVYAAFGERDKAFAFLEEAYATHDLQLQLLGVEPKYDSLRSDPRFSKLMRRIGLPE